MFDFEVLPFSDVAASFFTQCRQKSEMGRKSTMSLIPIKSLALQRKRMKKYE